MYVRLKKSLAGDFCFVYLDRPIHPIPVLDLYISSNHDVGCLQNQLLLLLPYFLVLFVLQQLSGVRRSSSHHSQLSPFVTAALADAFKREPTSGPTVLFTPFLQRFQLPFSLFPTLCPLTIITSKREDSSLLLSFFFFFFIQQFVHHYSPSSLSFIYIYKQLFCCNQPTAQRSTAAAAAGGPLNKQTENSRICCMLLVTLLIIATYIIYNQVYKINKYSLRDQLKGYGYDGYVQRSKREEGGALKLE